MSKNNALQLFWNYYFKTICIIKKKKSTYNKKKLETIYKFNYKLNIEIIISKLNYLHF